MRLFNHFSLFVKVFLKRSIVIQSDVDLGAQMKLLNNKKQFQTTLQLFDNRNKNNVETLSSLTITQALKACAHLRDLSRGSTIHRLISLRVKDDAYIAASLIHLYMQCGAVARAQAIFDTTTTIKRTSSMYGAMMKGYVMNKQAIKAINLFHEIRDPDAVNITAVLNACAKLRTNEALTLTKKVYLEMPKSYHSDPYLFASLLDALMKCGDVTYARSLFDVRTKKDLTMYGAMMKGYIINGQAQKAIDLYKEIKHPEVMNVVALFNACAQLRTKEALDLTKTVSNEIPRRFYSDPYLLTSLVDSLMKCGDIARAQSIFQVTTKKVLPMYGAMMKGYVMNNRPSEAIDLFQKIDNPDEIVTTLLFNACAQLGSNEALNLTKKISNGMPRSFHSNPYLSTSLLDALMKCGDVAHAQSLFETITRKELSMYGAMMKGYINNHQAKKAADLFNELESPDTVTTTALFSACAQLRNNEALVLVKQISVTMPNSFRSDPYLVTSLLDALMKCGDVASAQSWFDVTTKKVSQMYGAMMKGYIENKEANKAIDFYKQIRDPDEIIFTLLFNACAQIRTSEALNLIKTVWKQMPQSFHGDDYLVSSLLDALMKCGDVTQAQDLYENSTRKTLSMHGAMMKGYIIHNQASAAIDLFQTIDSPNEILLNLFFNACAQLGSNEALNSIKKISNGMPRSFHSNPYLFTSLLDALMKCGDVAHAQSLFETITKKELSMYGAMMEGYIRNNQSKKAIQIFKEISNPNDIVLNLLFNACAQLGSEEVLNLIKTVWKRISKSLSSNSSLLISLFDALIKCGDCSSAESLFFKMEKTVTSYGNLMSGFNKEKNPLKTLDLFSQMKQNGIEGNIIIYLCVFKALSQIGGLSLAQTIVQEIPHHFLADQQIRNTLIDVWGKCGYVDGAKKIFENMPQPDLFGYTAMIHGYGLNGMGDQAIELYQQMPEELKEDMSHVCVLNACSHSGLVSEARLIFEKIPVKTERIYTTMIDCLSRASLFEEAQHLIDQFEVSHSPGLVMYMALLSGARNVNNRTLSQSVYDRMKKHFPQMKNPLASAGILLANVYASSGDFDKASDIRVELQRSGTKKQVGLTWTVVNGQTYQFRAHDESHPRSSEIYAEVEKMSKEAMQYGYQHDSSWITRSLNEDETVASVLCGHSEKLAIAWNFVANPKVSQIQVAKNLRVCGDCHRMTKLIALHRQCEIIVRDANRIHHFHRDGRCSCNDYF